MIKRLGLENFFVYKMKMQGIISPHFKTLDGSNTSYLSHLINISNAKNTLA
jgi:hypothetical protein